MARDVFAALTAEFGEKKSRQMGIKTVSCAGSLLLGLGTLVLGVATLSVFTCANALYTFGTAFAKSCALAGLFAGRSQQEQFRYYKLSGLVLVLASVMYIIYSVRQLVFPENISVHMYAALGIATLSFTEITLNIIGVVRERKNHAPLFHALKMIDLASSLISLVLTQAALLSFASTQVQAHPQANAAIGVLMGAAAVVLGFLMIARIHKLQRCYPDPQEEENGKDPCIGRQ